MSTPASNWTCPKCGCYNPAEFKDCPCGAKPASVPPPTPPPSPTTRRRLPTWIAALPALIAPTYYMGHALSGFNTVSHAISGSTANKKAVPTGCIETYGITLSNSHEYVRSFGEFRFPGAAPRDPNTPRELATVLHGNILNHCGEPLRDVHINITVRDEKGTTGKATVLISELKPGISQQFERAWMAQIATWDIATDQ